MSYITTNFDGWYGKTFRIVGEASDFYAASKTCRDDGGSMPCIKNIVQQQYINSLTDSSVWLGGIDYYDEGSWECESGDALDWTNWAPNQPDNKCGTDTDADFSVMQPSGLWTDCGSNDYWEYSHVTVCAFDCKIGEDENCIVGEDMVVTEDSIEVITAPVEEYDGGRSVQVQSHRFVYITEPTDFFTASRKCYDDGGSIAVPRNSAEQEKLQAMITSESFVGVADYYDEGEFFNQAGPTLDYTNWLAGEPDNKYLDEDDADFVIMMYEPGQSNHGKWATKGSTTFWEHVASYFCEFGCDPSSDGEECLIY